jgi:sugar transferase (PEP-CTERM/EpsH1 system associated)
MNHHRPRRILMVAEHFPFPPNGGAEMRNFQLLIGLAGTDDVTLLTFSPPELAEKRLERVRTMVARVHTVPRPCTASKWKRQTQLAALLTPFSYQQLHVRSRALQRAIDELSRQQQFEVVQVEASHLAHFRFGRDVPVILDEHNIEYELLRRTSMMERSPPRKLYNWTEYVKFRRAEVRAWRSVAGCVFTSERERALAASAAPGTPCGLVPNGVDPDYIRPVVTTSASKNIVFTGRQDYRPNRDAALYFARSIFPLILREHPDATLSVVGQLPPQDVLHLAGGAVEVTGQVPDVRPYLERAAVAVAPLRAGGGTRLKILEAMAAGKPVVSTSIGCEGLAVQPGEHLLVADSPELFAQHVNRLLSDRALAGEMGARGRRLIEARYTWGALVKQLRNFHSETLERRLIRRSFEASPS